MLTGVQIALVAITGIYLLGSVTALCFLVYDLIAEKRKARKNRRDKDDERR